MSKDTRKDAAQHAGEHVSSHTVLQPDGELRTAGILQPGTYRMSTEAPERVEITQGRCRVKLADTQEWSEYGAGESFHVPGGSHYELDVVEGLDFVTHYGDVERCDD